MIELESTPTTRIEEIETRGNLSVTVTERVSVPPEPLAVNV